MDESIVNELSLKVIKAAERIGIPGVRMGTAQGLDTTDCVAFFNENVSGGKPNSKSDLGYMVELDPKTVAFRYNPQAFTDARLKGFWYALRDLGILARPHNPFRTRFYSDAEIKEAQQNEQQAHYR